MEDGFPEPSRWGAAGGGGGAYGGGGGGGNGAFAAGASQQSAAAAAGAPPCTLACGSLLEVAVPLALAAPGCTEPVVVRCGACQTLLNVALRSPLSGAPPSPLGAGGAPLPPSPLGAGGAPLPPSPLSPPPTPAAMQQAALQAALLARHRQLIAQMHPVGVGGGGYPAHWMAQPHAGGGGAPGGYPLGGGGSMLSLLSGGAPTPTQQRGSAAAGKATVPRLPTAYNLHMRAELKRLKTEQPAMEHKDAWRLASGSWKTSALNPRKDEANEPQLQQQQGALHPPAETAPREADVAHLLGPGIKAEAEAEAEAVPAAPHADEPKAEDAVVAAAPLPASPASPSGGAAAAALALAAALKAEVSTAAEPAADAAPAAAEEAGAAGDAAAASPPAGAGAKRKAEEAPGAEWGWVS